MNVNKFQFPPEAQKMDTWIEFLGNPKKYAKLKSDLQSILDTINARIKALDIGHEVQKALVKAQASAQEAAGIVSEATATKGKWKDEEAKERKAQTAKRAELTKREKALEADIAEFAKQREQIKEAAKKATDVMVKSRQEVDKLQTAAVVMKADYESRLAKLDEMRAGL